MTSFIQDILKFYLPAIMARLIAPLLFPVQQKINHEILKSWNEFRLEQEYHKMIEDRLREPAVIKSGNLKNIIKP